MDKKRSKPSGVQLSKKRKEEEKRAKDKRYAAMSSLYEYNIMHVMM